MSPEPDSPMNDRTLLITAPRVRCIIRRTYVVDWTWQGTRDVPYESDGSSYGQVEEAVAHHKKLYLSEAPAYHHAAWGYVINRRARLGCGKEGCACGDKQEGGSGDGELVQYHRVCKYCDTASALRIVKRLARWLRWRDSKRKMQLTEVYR